MYPEPRPAVILLEPREKLAGWIYLPFYVLLLPLLMGVIAGFVFVLLGRTPEEQTLTIHLNFAYGVVNFCFAGFFFRHYLVKSAQQIPQFTSRFLTALLGGFGMYLLGNFVMGSLTQMISPGMENINDAAIGAMAGVGALEMLIYTIVLVPLAEETIFRGLIFTTLRSHSRVAAYAVTVVAFSAIHVLGYIGTAPALSIILSFIQYIPASFALVWALEYSGSIWASIGIHTIANAFSMIGILLLT